MEDPQPAKLVGASADAATLHCRYCGARLVRTFVDLGMSPLCESFVAPDTLQEMEPFFPLHARICDSCELVQLPAFVPPEEIFTRYAYFSSYSTSWVEHARRFVQAIIGRLGLGSDDLVIEVASNDGYLLQHFAGTGIPFLGIDPAANVAEAARQRGVPTEVAFFGRELAAHLAGEGRQASLIVGNNVLAQVPDLNDFVGGIGIALRPNGTATFEFPHLLRLVQGVQYDTIYHEHFSYFSLATIQRILNTHGLELYDVEELATHGGSLRIYVQHSGGPHRTTTAIERVLGDERHSLVQPEAFAAAVQESKFDLLQLLIQLRRKGKRVAGYGAAGKANTLLNYCGIRTDLIEYIVDRNTYKQGRFTPGTHIPIHPPELIAETKPDFVAVLPWNLLEEISAQLAYITSWGGKLIVPIPKARVVDPGAP
jgi:SAM-dependent methyltransferase